MTELVDDLLDVSRVTRGLVAAGDGDGRPQGGHQQRRRAGAPADRCAQARVAHAAAGAPLWVQGDRTRLMQIFSNLLNNAAKYTPEGGELELTRSWPARG